MENVSLGARASRPQIAFNPAFGPVFGFTFFPSIISGGLKGFVQFKMRVKHVFYLRCVGS
jgi:hypothetical protein